MAAENATCVYQKTEELKILAEETWKNIYNYVKPDSDKTPYQISPTQLYEHQFYLTLFVDLTT